MSVSPKFFTNTPKKNISTINKTIDKNEEFSRQVTALISIELSRIDEEDIKNGINSLFVNQTEEQSIFIKGLLDKINNVKINIINKVKDFIIQNSNISNFNLDKNDYNDNSIINELKNLQKNMKIKQKQLNDCLSLSLNNSINQLSNYITLDKKDKALDKINKFDKIINELNTIVKGIENLQNKTIENILGKSINNTKSNNNTINNNKLRNYSRSPIKFNTTTDNQLKLKKTSSFIRYNNHSKNISPLNNRNFYNDILSNKTVNNISNIMTDSSLNKSTNSSFNLDNNINYKKKIKEKNFEIENLKNQLLKEKENKNKLLNELTKLKFNKKLSITKINNIDYDSINSKINKLTEMVINFSYSMNNLRDSIYKKSTNNNESKNVFTKLKNKLISLVNETETLNKNLLSLGVNLKENLEKENEENKKKEIDNTQKIKSSNLNNSLSKSEKNTNNIYNNITLNSTSNYDIEKIIAENKNLKAQIASQILLRSPKSNNEKEKLNENEIISLKNQIKKLQIELNEKNKEIDIINDNKINEYFNNLKENYQKNIKNIKSTYEQIIKEKENENNILNENNNEFEKEVYELRANLLKISNEYRTKHILIETKINTLENEKKNLEIQIENLNNENEDKENKKDNINTNNNDFNEEIISLKQKNENLEIIVENLNKQIEEKNNHINIITKNHQEDLNELNASIMVLKTKIAQLQEENESLSYSQRELLEKFKN